MGKRKEQADRSETLILNPRDEEKEDEEEAAEDDSNGFFACYLLCSLCPRFKGQTYIGFTVNPMRRIRQHNGEIRSGAWRTKSKRPWEMILCVYGFPTNVTALQFEWAWQHPLESLAVRKAAASLKSLSGIDGKIKIAYTMLTLPPWERLKLTVNFFSTKYMKNAAGFKSLPKQMKVKYCPMNELPCYTGCGQTFDDMDDEDEGEDADEARLKHLEEPTNSSLHDVSDVHEKQVRNKNDGVRRRGLQKPEEVYNMTSGDHRLPFELIDFPLPKASRSTNLVKSVGAVEHRDSLGSIQMRTNDCEPSTKQQVATAIPAKGLQQSSANDHLGPSEFCCKVVDLSTHTEQNHSSGLVQTTEDKDPIGLTGESSQWEGLISKQCSGTSSPSTKKLLAPPEIEVIDISTPSPNCIMHSFRQKKRRNNWVSQDIIDLTKSPEATQS